MRPPGDGQGQLGAGPHSDPDPEAVAGYCGRHPPGDTDCGGWTVLAHGAPNDALVGRNGRPTPLHRQRPHLEAAAPSPAPSAMCSRAAAVAPSGYPAGKAAVRDLLLRSERCREVDDAGKVSCTREPSNPSNRPTLAASRASCRASCQASCSVWRLLRSPRRNSPRRRFPPCNAHTVQEERQCLRQNVLAVSLHDPDAAAAAAGCATG